MALAFALLCPTGVKAERTASAVATLSNGSVDSITVTDGGSGYTSAPQIIIGGGGGSGATATAFVDANGAVTSITVKSPGIGYVTAPDVAIGPPDASFLDLQMVAQITIYGQIGSTNQVQSANAFGNPNVWTVVTNIVLTSSPFVFYDTVSPPGIHRFYRTIVQNGTRPTPPVGFVYLPSGRFAMGSPETEQDRYPDEGPQTIVTLSNGFYIGQNEVTQGEYLAVTGSNPSRFLGDLNRPVDSVSWYDATSYCSTLNGREWAAGRLPKDWEYRLPTEAEWEYAARAGSTNRFSYGDDPDYAKLGDYAWYYANSDRVSHAVGTKRPNRWGLYDMLGNEWEWCQTWYSQSYTGGSVIDPTGPVSGSERVLRGGGVDFDGRNCRSSIRLPHAPEYRSGGLGFRIVLAPVRGGAHQPPPAGFVYLPPGRFTMGSPPTEQDRGDDEGPQTVVTLTHGLYMGQHEVTQGEYLAVVGNNPSGFQGDLNRPVEQVSWDEAQNYCSNLTASEKGAGRLPADYVYRLPTEAEWEYAARAGTTTRFSFGDDPDLTRLGHYAWFEANSGNTTHPVGTQQPNPWGLYDMGGNVWQWCQDWYASGYGGGNVTDPSGPSSGLYRVTRGGSWRGGGRGCRSAVRGGYAPTSHDYVVGFRVVIAPGQP